MIECETVSLYKYEIRYNPNEKNEYEFIIVSDNMKTLVEEIVDRELLESMKDARKYLSIKEFLWMPTKDNWYCLFDIYEQNLAISYGYDVQEQYWKTAFAADAPQSVEIDDLNDVMLEFTTKMKKLHPKENYYDIISGDILAIALYESTYVQDGIRKAKNEKLMHESQELDDGMKVIDALMKEGK
jgi:hypothetical protein